MILRHPTTDSRISLYPGQNFGQSSIKRLHSLSYQKRLDICIVCEEVGTPPQLLLFDPKYKLISEEKGTMNDNHPLREDIDKIRTYRDAIRHEEVKRPVSFAGVIHPRKIEYSGNGISAIGCTPGYAGQEDIQKVLERFLRFPGSIFTTERDANLDTKKVLITLPALLLSTGYNSVQRSTCLNNTFLRPT